MSRLDSPVLDLGCGRGEWLELLVGQGYVARGVDLNAEFVFHGRQQGLDLVHAEAVDFLSAQPERSFSTVTSFHLAEHLPVGQLVELLAQIHRVLRPGGVMILETPNPENHVVGACNFYLDPTHAAPLPPALLEFLTEQAGFASVWVARVNADVTGVPLETVSGDAPNAPQLNAAIYLLNQIVFSAPDYAIVAQKAGGVISIAGSPELERLIGHKPEDVTTFRQLQAEARAQEAEAQFAAAEARAQEAEAQLAAAEARAQEAETQLAAAEARAHEAETQLAPAEARAHEAETQLAAVLGGASWRITRPLRWAKGIALRFARPG